MAPTARVTQPSGLSMQPINSSTKVRRERDGTATKTNDILSESSTQTELASDMRDHPGSRKIPHWSPRCSLQKQLRASNAATSQIASHVKCFSDFVEIYFAP